MQKPTAPRRSYISKRGWAGIKKNSESVFKVFPVAVRRPQRGGKKELVQERVTLHRLHSRLESVGATFLPREQSFDYQGKIGDKTGLISSNSYVMFTTPPSEARGSSLPSSSPAGRHCVLKTWASRARNRSKLGLISILLRELQLLAFLRAEGHSERRSISAKLRTDTGRMKHK